MGGFCKNKWRRPGGSGEAHDCAGLAKSCTRMDPAHTWTLHTHGLCTHVDPAHIDSAHTWILHMHGPCAHMNSAQPWTLHTQTMHTRGICTHRPCTHTDPAYTSWPLHTQASCSYVLSRPCFLCYAAPNGTPEGWPCPRSSPVS